MRIFQYTLVLLVLITCNIRICKSQSENLNKSISKEFIFDTASFSQCHASTIVELKDGRLLSAWFGGSHENAPDVSIYLSYNKKGKWSSPQLIADGKINDTLRYACWNPVLFRSSKGKLFLFYKVGKSPQLWWGMLKVSTNDGLSWSNAERLPSGFLGPIKNKPIELNDGTILCPSSIERGDDWKLHIESTSDEGKTWKYIPVDTASNVKAIQPCILKYPSNKLQLLCRSNQNFILQSWSTDNGKTWSKLTKTELPNPNSGIDAVTLSDGLQMLVYNPMEAGKEWVEGRNKLNLAMTLDGENWKKILELEDQKEGEFSYPAIIQTKDKRVHITYTYNRKRIKHILLNYHKLLHYPE